MQTLRQKRQDMGKIFLVIPDELEQEFRLEALKKYGGKKGHLGLAATEAFEEWVSKQVKEHQKR